MPCTADFFMTSCGSICHIYKKYIEAGAGGEFYHGELCGGCLWWEDSEEDKEAWERRERLGIKRRW